MSTTSSSEGSTGPVSVKKASGLKPPKNVSKIPGVTSIKSNSSSKPEEGVRGRSSSIASDTSDTSTAESAGAASVNKYILGDRVLVGGNRPGRILFLGDAHFAPGIWAGIVLDSPVGKNDGSVGGKRYFQCPMKHGVFARPEKLVYEAGSRSGSINNNNNNNTADSPKPPSEPSTPTILTPSSESAQQVVDMKVGDKVMVSGTKAGVVRFIGITDFAKGVWVGVELNETTGKNDGAVAGTRYFQCQPKHGIFAPVHKVTKMKDVPKTPSVTSTPTSRQKLPPTKKPGSVQSPLSPPVLATLTPGGLMSRDKHGGSNSSVSSMSSCSSLNKTLQHAALTVRSTRKTHELSAHAIPNSNTCGKPLEECETERNSLKALVQNSDKEKMKLMNSLEEEKRKVDDLQFRIEEESITRGELSAEINSRKQKVQILENQLQDARDDLNDLRVSANNNQTSLSEESSSRDLQELSTKVETLEAELASTNKLRVEIEAEYQETKEELEDLTSRRDSLEEHVQSLTANLDVKDTELFELMKEVSESKMTVSDIKCDLKASETKCTKLTKEKQALEHKFNDMVTSSGDSSQQMTILNEENKHKDKIIEEKNVTITEYGKKARHFERLCEDLKQERKKLYDKMKHENEEWRKELETKTSELEKLKSVQETLKHSAEQRDEFQKSSLEEFQNREKTLLDEKNNLKSSVENTNTIIQEKDKELEKLKTQLDQLTLSHMENTGLKVKLTECQNDNTALTHTLAESVENCEQFKSDLILSTEKTHSLKKNITNLECQHRLLTDELSVVSTALKSTQEERDGKKILTEDLQNSLKLLENDKVDLQSRVKGLGVEIDEKNKQFEIHISQIAALETDITGFKVKLSESEDLLVEYNQIKSDLATSWEKEEGYRQVLDELETQYKNVSQALDELKSKPKTDSDTKLKSQIKQLQNREKLLVSEKMDIEKSLNNSSTIIQHKDSELTSLHSQVTKLKSEHESMMSTLSSFQNNDTDGAITTLQQQSNTLLSQVEFLNSVIVDLQKKCKDQEWKLEALDMDPYTDPSSMFIDGDPVKPRVPPRLFCDICDMFDLHDTEDCPAQAMSDDSPPQSRHNGPRHSERPYCETCEVFGHRATDCDDEQTF